MRARAAASASSRLGNALSTAIISATRVLRVRSRPGRGDGIGPGPLLDGAISSHSVTETAPSAGTSGPGLSAVPRTDITALGQPSASRNRVSSISTGYEADAARSSAITAPPASPRPIRPRHEIMNRLYVAPFPADQ